MTTTISNPFLNERPTVRHASETLLATLYEFTHDCANKCESDCDAWGIDNYVFPASSFDDCVLLLLNNPDFKESCEKGELHFEIQEKADGDDIDAVRLKAGYLDIQQVIYFEDLPS